MSDPGAGVEWVDTAGEEVVVVVTEDRLPVEGDTAAVLPVLEPSASAAATAAAGAAPNPIQKLLESAVADGDEAEAEAEGTFYCEECQALFQDQDVSSTNISGPSFVLDFPTSPGVPQRALLSLPHGLAVGRSSIPGAGVGVLNHGPPLGPGMHFGPCEGELSTLEQALASDYSWEISRGKEQFEYLDATRESHSNWMRYVNFARSQAEMNLLAVQYRGSILFHCCRTISPGDELLVWPSRQLLQLFSATWTQVWLMRLNARENDCSTCSAPVFLCSSCQLTFTTQSFLQRHTLTFHPQPGGGSTKVGEASAATADDSAVQPPQQQEDLSSVDSAEANTCSDCGKMFKQLPHLRRHRLCVHSNQRPYCCPQCRRSFSQASGLVRHQRVHRRPRGGGARISSVAEIDIASDAAEEVTVSLSGPSNCSHNLSSDVSLREHRTAEHPVAQDLSQDQSKVPQHRHSATAAASTVPSTPQQQAEEPQLPLEQREPTEVSAGSDPSLDPQNPAQPVQTVGAERRPQRLRAKSNISAITRLIAPKSRMIAKRGSPDPDPGSTHPDQMPRQCSDSSSDPVKPKNLRCSSQRRTSVALKRRQQTAHSSGSAKSYSCERCRKDFSNPGNLRQHRRSNSCVRYHCTSELFSCPHCQFSFTLKSFLLKHVKRHHPVEYLARCESMDPTEQLQEQEQDQDQEKHQYQCPHCTLRCSSAKEFKSHSCFQQVKVLYLCTDCGKGFSNHYGLKQHQRVHTGEKPYTCPHCAKTFSYTGQLTVHLRTHTGEKPYLCTHCGDSFRQSGDLKRHERKHTGVRPHSCPECRRSFSRPQSLRAHQLLHQGQKMFQCVQCGKSFSRSYHLRRHQQKMHL